MEKKCTERIIDGIENRKKESLITVSHNTKGVLNKLVGNGLQTRYYKSFECYCHRIDLTVLCRRCKCLRLIQGRNVIKHKIQMQLLAQDTS